MSTLSVPLTPDLEAFIAQQVKSGDAPNKASVVRKALVRLRQEESVLRVLRSQQEAREGKLLRGDLDELATMIN